MSAGLPGRGGVEPRALEHVGAVQPGGPDVDEQLARPRLGIGVLPPLEPAVDDRHCPHGPNCRRRSAAGALPCRAMRADLGPRRGGRLRATTTASGVELDADEARDPVHADRRSRAPRPCRRARRVAAGCVAVVALVDVLAGRPRTRAAASSIELADEAPTLHLYVEDVATECRTTSGTTRATRSGPTPSTTNPAWGVSRPELASRRRQRATSNSAPNDSSRQSRRRPRIGDRRRVEVEPEVERVLVAQQRDVQRAAGPRPHREAGLDAGDRRGRGRPGCRAGSRSRSRSCAPGCASATRAPTSGSGVSELGQRVRRRRGRARAGRRRAARARARSGPPGPSAGSGP